MAKVITMGLKTFIPKDERDSVNPLTWYYTAPTFGMQKTISSKQVIKTNIGDSKKKGEQHSEFTIDNFRNQLTTLVCCLKRVENLFDDKGEAIQVPSNEKDKIKFIEALPTQMAIELLHWINVEKDVKDETSVEEDTENGELKNE